MKKCNEKEITMKSLYYFLFISLGVSNCLQASHLEQREHQKADIPTEFLLLKETKAGTLTEKSLQAYIKQGVNINAEDSWGNTALTIMATTAAVGDKIAIDILQNILAAGADVNARNSFGMTPLMFVVISGGKNAKKVIKLLIDAGVDLNAVDNQGKTPLMNIAGARFPVIGNRLGDAVAQDMVAVEIVQQLVDAGADPNYRNEKDNNKIARDYAGEKIFFDEAVKAGLAERQRREVEAKKE